MNERIQELITAYLHRGSTPDQERELFEACKSDPDTAEMLRQHLVLSLKLRKLRDDVEVKDELRASLYKRLDDLDVEPRRTPAAAVVPQPAPRPRFSLGHLFGTALGTAAAAAVVVMLWLPQPEDSREGAATPLAKLTDTVYIIETDTVTQVRTVQQPVFITRVQERDEDAEDGSPNRVQQDLMAERADPAGTPDLVDPAPAADTAYEEQNSSAESAPLFVDARPLENLTREEKTQNYIDQYNAMLVSVESVKLTAKDRISY